MRTIKVLVLATGLLISVPFFTQLAEDTENTGAREFETFVSGRPGDARLAMLASQAG